MDFAELWRRVAGLPGIGDDAVPYLIGRVSPGGDSSGTPFVIVDRGDGRYGVRLGDQRSAWRPALADDGSELVFPDEHAVCEWVYAQVVAARTPDEGAGRVSEAEVRASAERQRRRVHQLGLD